MYQKVPDVAIYRVDILRRIFYVMDLFDENPISITILFDGRIKSFESLVLLSDPDSTA